MNTNSWTPAPAGYLASAGLAVSLRRCWRSRLQRGAVWFRPGAAVCPLSASASRCTRQPRSAPGSPASFPASTALPSGSAPPGDHRASARPVLLEAAEPEHRDPRPFLCPAADPSRLPVGGFPAAGADTKQGGAAVQQTIDRATSHRRPGLPRTGGSAPRGPLTTVPGPGAAPPAVPGRGPRPVVRRDPAQPGDRQEPLRQLPGARRLPRRGAGPGRAVGGLGRGDLRTRGRDRTQAAPRPTPQGGRRVSSQTDDQRTSQN